ncbi:PLP-dependent aminotransferase family protein [Micromonospora peucetia]|uniref:DNA-binding transcriptional regulator, MocR family, contains an aminotransferase domain n=1 Tax=Micromonospora peucetia TaxID=47871 RepID=A0A1C6VU86_9ACTN|nr:PLP-dependent aminotransferase family protein [Micromonospora peucetia]SCL69782.1 DNA-binding transcriptional regulator, MocR family, contains an aminotransferase domain [Micromonospora peucetia]
MSESSTIERLVTSLRAEIARLTPGDRLPSSRDLVRRHAASPVSVARAVAVLAAEGAVVTRPGSGTFVAARSSRAFGAPPDTSWQAVALADRSIDAHTVTDLLRAPPADAITMAGGYLHRSLQPTKALGDALARAARRPDAWDRAPTAGLETLRALFASFAGGDVDTDDVLITSGGQDGLSMAFRAIAAPGSPILVESPTYQGALAAARAAGLRPVPVPVDDDGIRPDLLADAFATSGARLLYIQPTFHNPTGAVLSAQRRPQILDVARAAGAFILEDDFARLLGHGGAVPRPLVADDADGTVVYLTSLTKPASPSLRIGALIARGPVMARLRAIRLVDDFFISRPIQEAAIELLSAPAWDRHLRSLATALRERCTALTAGLARHTPEWTVMRIPAGGLHLWVRLPSNDLHHITDAAQTHGVAVSPGNGYFAAEPPSAYMRVGFAAAADLAQLAEGARRLGEVARGRSTRLASR